MGLDRELRLFINPFLTFLKDLIKKQGLTAGSRGGRDAFLNVANSSVNAIYSKQFNFRQGAKPRATGVYIKLNTDGEKEQALSLKLVQGSSEPG
ncbi:MAG TPA: hypothetical protein VJ205_00095 [Gammaproteobacteria bacterium]|nr:hypothetical protein [Gammaproteobacteria bacterium]